MLNKYIEKYKQRIELMNDNNYEIEIYKQFLTDTDYVITKIAEENALGKDIKPLVDEYKEVIEARKEAREMINQLQNNKE